MLVSVFCSELLPHCIEHQTARESQDNLQKGIVSCQKVTKGKACTHRAIVCLWVYLGMFFFYMMRFSTCESPISATFQSLELPTRCMTYPPAVAELEASRRDSLVGLST